ncbi:MAG: 5'/3'-nucleotidase SurE [Spirochaetia bacterium]|nr:5'/3'-nucleotidase SurE [Spirochaetia bacterium]
MRILLTNDDGLRSNGMLHLEAELSAHFEVWAIAPDRERSATSQAISNYMVTGFPADCVNVALHWGEFPKFDLVVSGINHGPNLGDDLHYSGTVGAARHAAVHGLRAIAVSTPIKDHAGDFRRVAAWLRTWIQENASLLKHGIVYNINYPAEQDRSGPFPKVAYTSHGRRVYKDTYEDLEEGTDYLILHLKETIMGESGGPDTDFAVLSNGQISITPVSIQTTDREELEIWRKRHPTESD